MLPEEWLAPDGRLMLLPTEWLPELLDELLLGLPNERVGLLLDPKLPLLRCISLLPRWTLLLPLLRCISLLPPRWKLPLLRCISLLPRCISLLPRCMLLLPRCMSPLPKRPLPVLRLLSRPMLRLPEPNERLSF